MGRAATWSSAFDGFSKSIVIAILLALVSVPATAKSDDAKNPEIVVTKRTYLACDPLDGADDLLGHMRSSGKPFLIVGELHGTEQIPKLFGDLACHAATIGAVNVVLEFPTSDQTSLDRFVASPSDKINDLTEEQIWHSKMQDGRSSAAMFNLFLYLRKLSHVHDDVRLFFAQPQILRHLIGADYYNLEMAFTWARIADERPDAMTLILVGSAHARQAVQNGGEFVPAAAHLPSGDVVSLRPELSGGEAWNCALPALQCGPHAVHAFARKPRFVGELMTSADGFRGTYSVGSAFTSSRPFIGSEPSAEPRSPHP